MTRTNKNKRRKRKAVSSNVSKTSSKRKKACHDAVVKRRKAVSSNVSKTSSKRKKACHDAVVKRKEARNSSCESLEDTANVGMREEARNSGCESLEDVPIYHIIGNVKSDVFRRIVKTCINSHGCNVIGEQEKIAAEIEKDCVGTMQRIINTSSAWSCKKFTLKCLKVGFDQYGSSDMWNMFSARNKDFAAEATAEDYVYLMEKIEREQLPQQ